MLHICSSMLQNQLFLTQGTLKHPEKQEYCLLQNIHTILSHFYENTRYAAFSLFCSNYAAVCCKKCIFGMSTRRRWFYLAKIPPQTKNHAFFKICSRILLFPPTIGTIYTSGEHSAWKLPLLKVLEVGTKQKNKSSKNKNSETENSKNNSENN